MSLDRAKLAKVLAMGGSAYDGEAAAALRRAEAMLKAAGMDWGQLLGGSGAADDLARQLTIAVSACEQLIEENDRLKRRLARATTTASPAHWIAPTTNAEKIDWCANFASLCSDWEREFVVSLAGRRWALTEKQQNRLDELVAKIERLARLQRVTGAMT
jgi:hypothetical protein